MTKTGRRIDGDEAVVARLHVDETWQRTADGRPGCWRNGQREDGVSGSHHAACAGSSVRQLLRQLFAAAAAELPGEQPSGKRRGGVFSEQEH